MRPAKGLAAVAADPATAAAAAATGPAAEEVVVVSRSENPDESDVAAGE